MYALQFVGHLFHHGYYSQNLKLTLAFSVIATKRNQGIQSRTILVKKEEVVQRPGGQLEKLLSRCALYLTWVAGKKIKNLMDYLHHVGLYKKI